MLLDTTAHFILYVEDQDSSTRFWTQVFDAQPDLFVPGMTEFQLSENAVLGLMPTAGIRRLLPEIPDPSSASGIPRAELYLIVPHPDIFHGRALAAGAVELSPLLPRDWGHACAYSLDPDGHIIAFARTGRP